VLDSSPGKLFHIAENTFAEKLVDPSILGLRTAPRSHNVDAKGQYVICFGFSTVLSLFCVPKRPREGSVMLFSNA